MKKDQRKLRRTALPASSPRCRWPRDATC